MDTDLDEISSFDIRGDALLRGERVLHGFILFDEIRQVDAPEIEKVSVPPVCKSFIVPLSERSVILDNKFPLFVRSEVACTNHGNFFESGFFAGFQAHIPTENDSLVIHDDGTNLEHLWEVLDRLDELSIFLVLDGAGIVGIGFDSGEWSEGGVHGFYGKK